MVSKMSTNKLLSLPSMRFLRSFRSNQSIFDPARSFTTCPPFRAKSQPSTDSQTYCMNLVKHYDYENFLCTLLLNNSDRRAAMAIRAFNVEIARIPFLVSDPKIGEMRFKFWEETISKLFGKDSRAFIPEQNQPVVQELRRLLGDNSKKFTKRNFDRLWMARRNQSVNFSFLTTNQLEDYCEQSVSSVYYLLLENRNIKNLNVDHCASHLGKAQGIVNVLRSISKAQRASNVPVPQELLMKHGVSQERVYRDKPDDKGVEECIFELSTTAHQHLEKSRSMAYLVPKEALPIFLPAISIARYLERLRRANFHLTTKTLTDRDSTLPVALYWSRLRGKF